MGGTTINERLEDINRKHTSKVAVSDKDKMRMINNGEVSLRRTARLNEPLGDAFDFLRIEDTKVLYDTAEYRKEVRAARVEAARVEDEIMLGDGAKALKLIEKFCR